MKKLLLKRGTSPPAALLNVLFSYAFWNQNVITVALLKWLEASMFNQAVICPMPNETEWPLSNVSTFLIKGSLVENICFLTVSHMAQILLSGRENCPYE